LIEIENTTADKKPSAETVTLYPVAEAIATVCNMSLEKNRGMLFKEAKLLHESADEIIRQYGPGGWWYASDWRGKKEQPPRPAQIRETWGAWKANTTQADALIDFGSKSQRRS
jgi:hypothetical protein